MAPRKSVERGAPNKVGVYEPSKTPISRDGVHRAVCGTRKRIFSTDGSHSIEGGLRVSGEFKKTSIELPLVSVVTVCMNAAKTIHQCIDSVLSQTYKNIEYIIVDGASDDGTVGLIEEKSAYVDYFISEPDDGLYDAMNKGLSLCTGDYILLLNSDDWYEPECIETLIEEFQKNDVDMVSAQARYVNDKGEEQFITPPAGLDITARIRNPLRHETLLVPTWVYEKFGPYDTHYQIIADFHFIIKLYEAGLRHRVVRKPLLNFRNSGVSSTDMRGLVSERLALLKEQFPTVSEEALKTVSDLQNLSKTQAAEVLALTRTEKRFYLAFKQFAKQRWQTDLEESRNEGAIPARGPAFRVETFCMSAGGGAGTGSARRISALRSIGVSVGFNALLVPPHSEANRLRPSSGANIAWPDLISSESVLNRQNAPGFKAYELFTSTNTVIRMAELLPIVNRADVLHFHWMGGILDYQALHLIKNMPIVWTLADMAAFTGGCHYSEGCEGFVQQCSECPLIGERRAIPRRTHAIKRAAYSQLRHLEIICPSEWLAEKARRSSLLSNIPIHVIPNPLPVQEFTPTNKVLARLQLGLPTDRKLILFGSDNLNNRRKGGDLLPSLVRYLKNDPATNDAELVLFGRDVFPDLGIPLHRQGHITDAAALSLVYSAVDAFVFPSREDNAPLTVCEALLCGTPVVGFPVGNVPEVVQHGQTGYIADHLNVESLAKGIAWALSADASTRISRGVKCRLSVIKFGDPRVSAEAHLSLYERLIAKAKGDKLRTTNDVAQTRRECEPLVGNAEPLKRCKPRILVVTPCMNAVDTIDETINSVVTQEGDFEIMYHVQDGGSSDGTIGKLQKWEAFLSAEKYRAGKPAIYFSWRSAPDRGMYDAILAGFECIKHRATEKDFLTWINADDLIANDAFKIVAAVARKLPQVEWLGSPTNNINEDGSKHKSLRNPVPTEIIREGLCDAIHWDGHLQQEGTFFRKRLWDRASDVLNSFCYAGDWALWWRFSQLTRYYQSDTPLGVFRIRAGQLSRVQKEKYNAEIDTTVPRQKRTRRFWDLYDQRDDLRVHVVSVAKADDIFDVKVSIRPVLEHLFKYANERRRMPDHIV